MHQQNLSRTLSRPEFSQLQLFGFAHWRVHTGRSKCCPITKPIHYFVRLWAEPVEDLSFLISNSRVVALYASLQSPTVPTSAIWAARPYCISTGETSRQRPWSSRHCHRACPAHNQLPEPGRETVTVHYPTEEKSGTLYNFALFLDRFLRTVKNGVMSI